MPLPSEVATTNIGTATSTPGGGGGGLWDGDGDGDGLGERDGDGLAGADVITMMLGLGENDGLGLALGLRLGLMVGLADDGLVDSSTCTGDCDVTTTVIVGLCVGSAAAALSGEMSLIAV